MRESALDLEGPIFASRFLARLAGLSFLRCLGLVCLGDVALPGWLFPELGAATFKVASQKRPNRLRVG